MSRGDREPAGLPADLADKYFTRRAPWDWRSSNEIDVLDVNGGLAHSLDRWQTLVFEGADSGRTAGAFVTWLRAEYPAPGALPEDLEAVVDQALRQLADEWGVIVLSQRPEHLPYDFDIARSRQKPGQAPEA